MTEDVRAEVKPAYKPWINVVTDPLPEQVDNEEEVCIICAEDGLCKTAAKEYIYDIAGDANAEPELVAKWVYLYGINLNGHPISDLVDTFQNYAQQRETSHV